MVHIDIAVENLEAGLAWALEVGATLSRYQPQADICVMLDPDGHPFCLFQGSARGEFDAVDWNGPLSLRRPDAGRASRATATPKYQVSLLGPDRTGG
jgi:hypothetical protein